MNYNKQYVRKDYEYFSAMYITILTRSQVLHKGKYYRGSSGRSSINTVTYMQSAKMRSVARATYQRCEK
jgi:hypothetical protein